MLEKNKLINVSKEISMNRKVMIAGNWKMNGLISQSVDLAKQMNSDFQSLIYSYLEGDELVNSPDVSALTEKTEKIVDALGGLDWSKTFLNNSPKEEREKTQENIAKVRFFIVLYLSKLLNTLEYMGFYV